MDTRHDAAMMGSNINTTRAKSLAYMKKKFRKSIRSLQKLLHFIYFCNLDILLCPISVTMINHLSTASVATMLAFLVRQSN